LRITTLADRVMQEFHDSSKDDINENVSKNSLNLDNKSESRAQVVEGHIQPIMTKQCGCGGYKEGNESGGCSCNSERSNKLMPISPSYVYSIGKVVARFPSRSIELELAQAIGRRSAEETKGLAHEEVIYRSLTDPNNRYIARQICYVLTIEGLETYILVPSYPLDIDRLAQAIRPIPGDLTDIDIII